MERSPAETEGRGQFAGGDELSWDQVVSGLGRSPGPGGTRKLGGQ